MSTVILSAVAPISGVNADTDSDIAKQDATISSAQSAQAQAQNMVIGSALNAASTGIKAYGSQYTPSTTGQDTSPSGYTYEPLGGSATKGTGYLSNFSFID